MSPEERDQLVEAVRAALIPFKEELKADLLDPMEARLQAQLDNLAAGQASMRARLDGVEARLDGVEARLDGVEARLDGVEARLDSLEAGQASLRARLNGVETRLEGLEAGQASIRTRLDGVETRMEGLERQMGNLDRRITSMNDDSLTPFIHIAGRQHQELVERVERLERAFSGLRSDVQRIERGPVRQLVDAAADTRGRLTTIEQRLAERGVLTPEQVAGTGERWVTWSEYRELEARVRILEETAASYDILPGEDE